MHAFLYTHTVTETETETAKKRQSTAKRQHEFFWASI